MSSSTKSSKGKNFLSKTKSFGSLSFTKLFKSLKNSKATKSLEVIEKPKKELTTDEIVDLEIYSIINGTSDADQYFHYDGNENVVDIDKFYEFVASDYEYYQ